MYGIKSPKGKVIHSTSPSDPQTTACGINILYTWDFVTDDLTCRVCTKILEKSTPADPVQELARLAKEFLHNDYLNPDKSRRMGFLADLVYKPNRTKIEITIEIDLISHNNTNGSLEEEVKEAIDYTLEGACWIFDEYSTKVKVTEP